MKDYILSSEKKFTRNEVDVWRMFLGT